MTRGPLVSALVVLAACFQPLGITSADAQQPAPPRHIGVVLGGFSLDSNEALAFRQGLRDVGYVEGRDVVIEWRSGAGDSGRIPTLVADLVQRRPDVIVVDTTVATRAAKSATSAIPIVMTVNFDPVGSGLVANLAHPGGNVTGLSAMGSEMSSKRLQLLKEMMPGITRVAVLWNPDTPYSPKAIAQLKAAAPSLSMTLTSFPVRTPGEIDSAFSAISRTHAQALYLVEDALFEANRPALFKLALKARLPIICWVRHWPEEGGLMSYGPSISDLFRRSAGYIDKILKGANPADLPIEQPTKFELVVNLKTAKALGITIPESILLRADEVIR
jgi:putative tryptophan/tyrosine transport system substrate-binding protein